MDKNETFCHYSGLPSLSFYEKGVENTKQAPVVLSDEDRDRIIQMAWEDRTPFDAIEFQFGLKEAAVKKLMKENLRLGSYKLWRERVESSNKKHLAKRNKSIDRFKSNSQRAISNNKIPKR